MDIELEPKIAGDRRREVRTGTGETVELKPREFTVRKFRPGEFGSKWAERGVFDGDKLLGLADLQPDGAEQQEQHRSGLIEELSKFERQPEGAAPGAAQKLLDETISVRMSEFGESRELAERAVVQTDTGLLLWNRARRDRMEFD